MSKKNLDKLFQEKFSDFSDHPTEKVWNSIDASLNKKKKTRVIIPFWWKLGGIAAALAIGLFLINPFNNDGNEANTSITDIENSNEKQPEVDFPVDPTASEKTPQVVEDDISNAATAVDADQKNNSASKKTNDYNTTLVKRDNPQKTEDQQKTANTAVALQDSQEKTVNGDKNLEALDAIDKSHGLAVNETLKTEDIASDNKVAIQKGSSIANEGLKAQKEQLKNVEPEQAVVDVKPDVSDKNNEAKKSIFDEITEQEEKVAEAKGSKWSAGPSIAPVYFSAMGEGSPVHSIFVPNSKSGDVNLSYGLAVSYEINKKLSLKTGIHKVDYGYTTNDVEFSATLEGFNGQIENIDYSQDSQNLLVESKASNGTFGTENKALDAASKDPSLLGVMAQQFGYLEVPLELNYTLVDSKFGLNLVGGLSSLFLIDNAVVLSSGELTTEMGEANNLNTLNFSTNIGFGVNYKFSQKVQLNIEPVFKYQLNTFSDTAGNFQPFTIGVYSGLNFRF